MGTIFKYNTELFSVQIFEKKDEKENNYVGVITTNIDQKNYNYANLEQVIAYIKSEINTFANANTVITNNVVLTKNIDFDYIKQETNSFLVFKNSKIILNEKISNIDFNLDFLNEERYKNEIESFLEKIEEIELKAVV